ncbi:hypothetical protein FSARC_79 [Fusarium sarcochroum]|uniref:FAD/NAD(P)-binding domain-containing protein n=1 Tax=Fusarium sarcochroum TaxID=1208366 RepID=A0A8H4UCL0_9HYPO|nr:hypothetical protein FSARC_79 [Fusarium sarcochroum]
MSDVQSLKAKYEAEREKRWAASTVGKAFTLGAQPTTTSLDRDPWVDYKELAKQPPVLIDQSKIKFLILGAGGSGILFAYHLISRGFSSSDIVLVDDAGGFGGTWYWNRYPGLTCDVEGYSYLPLLEETGFVPKERYASGEDIRHNDNAEKHWKVKLHRNLGPDHPELNGPFVVSAQFLLPCGGVLSSPNAPDLPGLPALLENRKVFHTSRWDYDYTGGSPAQPDMVNLRDKAVGIVGTGATAVQVVPQLAKWAKHVYVFQRTPSFCGPREQVLTTPEEWAQITKRPGWQYERMRNLAGYLNDDPDLTEDDDIVKDGWSGRRSFAGAVGSPRAKTLSRDQVEGNVERMLREDGDRCAKLHQHIDEVVKNPSVAERLKPWYPGWCKRPTFNQDYPQSFNKPNVSLVDTDGQGVQSYTKSGVKASVGGTVRDYEVDLLVLATGFEVSGTTSPATALGSPIAGRNGLDMTEKWDSGDFGTLYGVATHGFPNLFFYSSKAARGLANTTFPVYLAAKLAASVIKRAFKEASTKAIQVEVSKDAERQYTQERLKTGHCAESYNINLAIGFGNETEDSSYVKVTSKS